MGGIHFICAVHSAGADNADGRLLGEHGARLHRRGVRAQQQVLVKIEGILRISGGMVLGQVQQLKVVFILLDLRAFGNRSPCPQRYR